MTIDYKQFIKDISKIDAEDICSDWQWLLQNKYSPIMISLSGDMFLTDANESIFWLDTGKGQMTQIADSSDQFHLLLEDIDNIDEWFLASTVLGLIEVGSTLSENELYSYKTLPILGGGYSLNNLACTDISVHFSIAGQICMQVANLPVGIRINKVVIK